ncbi:MAG: FMN-dependent NADH-azoreductase [Bacillota bacterium]
MSKVLCVIANPKTVEESKSLTMAREFLDVYRKNNPQDTIIEMDVYRENIPLIDVDVFAGWGKYARNESLTPTEQEKVGKIAAYTEQFLEADKYIFVTPMWNLSLPPLMKAYIDTIVIAGKTFKYTEEGPVGLVEGKKAAHIHSRGGVYSNPPMTEMDFADRYLKTLLNFLGIKDVVSIICEGHEYAPDKADQILKESLSRIREAAARF